MTEIILIEKVIIKFLFFNEKIRDKILPFLSPKVFDNKNNIAIVEKALSFLERFDKFPTVLEMKLDLKNDVVYAHLKEIMDIDISQYNNEFILSEIEDFFKKSLVTNYNVDIAVALGHRYI
jgi:hypothetical protein